MRSVLVVIACLALYGGMTAGQPQLDREEPAQTENLKNAMNKFAVELFTEVSKRQQEKNFVVSPAGAYMGLASLLYGTKYQPEQILRRILHLPTENLLAYQGTFENILDEVNINTTVSAFITKSRIFARPTVSLRPSFGDILKNTFKSALENVDFHDRTAAAEAINSWEKRAVPTMNPPARIPTVGIVDYFQKLQSPETLESESSRTIPRVDQPVLTPDTLVEETSLLFVNSVRLYVEWLNQFMIHGTSTEDFAVDETTTKRVPIMFLYDKLDFGYLPKLNASFVVMPCKDGGKPDKAITVYWILPNASIDLRNLEENFKDLTLDDLHNTVNNTRYEIDVRLPRFRINNTLELVDSIAALGSRRLFTHSIALHGLIDGTGPKRIRDIVQKTGFSAAERGVEGAADPSSIDTRSFPKSFFFDRPFYFVAATKNLILLTGKVVDPAV